MKMKKLQNEEMDLEKESLLLYMHDIVYLLAGIMIVLMLLFRTVNVSGPSMMDTLQNGDNLLVVSHAIAGDPQYGDIVVLSKNSFKDGEPIIKRVIATEGQVVDINFKTGMVYVDGKALQESYARVRTHQDWGTEFPLTVEEGCIFVLGDNREVSMDSRDPQIGQIDTREVIGRAIFLIFPGKGMDENGNRDFKRIGVLN